MARKDRSNPANDGDGVSTAVPAHNLLLALISAEPAAAILEHATTVSLSLRESIFEASDPITSVYFPIDGMISLVNTLNDGTSIEAMTVGREGFVGLPLFHGVQNHRSQGICQIEGTFCQLDAKAFTDLVKATPQLHAILHRYAQFSNEAVTQSSACNASHLIEQRCARWLLTTSDSIGRKKFRLTQEFLSQMLAVRRPGVTLAIGALVRQGLIAHTYGLIDIVDLEGLKKVSCECYETMRKSQRELLSS